MMWVIIINNIVNMGSDYNSVLISRLYNETNTDKLIEVVREIKDIADPVFLRPLFDAYKKYFKSYITHYFISAIGEIKSPNAPKLLETILLECVSDRQQMVAWTLRAMLSKKYITDEAVTVTRFLIENIHDQEFKKSYGLDNYDISALLEYLSTADALDGQIDTLYLLIYNESFNKDEVSTILSYLTRINPSVVLEKIKNNFEGKIGQRELGIIIAKELLKWQGPIVEALTDKIISNGHERAREILEKERDRKRIEKETQEKTGQVNEQREYVNQQLIIDVIEVRERVNNKCLANENINFNLFPASEEIVRFAQNISDEAMFVKFAIALRSIIKGVNPKIYAHGLSEEKVQEMLPDSKPEELKKTLNTLFIYLTSRNVPIDNTLFGLKKLYRATTLVAHPEDKAGLVHVLKEWNLYEDYEQKNWNKVLRHLLEKYVDILEKIHNVIP